MRRNSWTDAYKRGVDLFTKSKYEEALEAFNEAIRGNDHNKALFESRAIVLDMLGHSSEAKIDWDRAYDVGPPLWQQPIYMIQPDRPFFPRLEPEGYFTELPIELQIEIFTLAIAGSEMARLVLTCVCRTWREIINGTSSFCSHIVLNDKTTQEEADAWFQRAGGYLYNLRIGDGFSFLKLPDVFRNASPDIWSNLGSFEIDYLGKSNSGAALPPEIARRLRPEKLKIELEVWDPSSEYWKSLVVMDMSQTRNLHLVVKGRLILSNLPLFTSLTKLELTGRFYVHDFLVFLERCPAIEVMTLAVISRNPTEEPERTVTLANLKVLGLDVGCVAGPFARSFVAPNLRVLTLNGNLSPKAIAFQRAMDMDVILMYLRGHNFSRNKLIEFLRKSDGVRRLILRLESSDGSEEAVIDALSGTIPVTEDQETSEMLCCPRLEHLDVSFIPNLSAGPLVRIVKARLPRASPAMHRNLEHDATAEVLPHPLLSFKVRASGKIDLESIAWLRAHVPNLSIEDENIADSSIFG